MVAGALVVLLTLAVVGVAWLREQRQIPPLPFEQRCVATSDSGQVVLTRDQAHWTAIVVGVGVERGIGVHGATIAMATVYQETGIRNLDYGDRDSLGLFQQRPSQDWGTPQQIMDPWYAAGQFYDSLVEVPGWETGDVNDTAQAVQRSGHPDAYRKHEQKARVLAEVFTGAAAAGLSCFDERARAGEPDTFRGDVRRTFGDLPLEVEGPRAEIRTEGVEHAWAISAYAVANAGRLGITEIAANGQRWIADQRGLPSWVPGEDPAEGTVVVTFR
ncbi:MAG: hypothetical protein Q4F67_14020 [Propionibacteriaceae bacterium]|nr:hypothetical protein [Propionibacteriaceae bacterium]